MSGKVTSYEIKEALARKHGNREFFMAEVKNGPTGVVTGQLLQFDGVAIYKSWSNPQIRGYEVKVSRSDFLRDAKYPCYLPYFHEFYFVVPKGMVQKNEVEEGIGLMWYDPETGVLTTKKRAVHRKIEVDAAFLLYIIMTRLSSDRAPFMHNKGEVFQAWLKGKETSRELAYRVKSKLIQENAELQAEVRQLRYLEDAQKELKALRAVMEKHNIATGRWREVEALEQALSRKYAPELDKVQDAAYNLVSIIEGIKRRAQKEATHE